MVTTPSVPVVTSGAGLLFAAGEAVKKERMLPFVVADASIPSKRLNVAYARTRPSLRSEAAEDMQQERYRDSARGASGRNRPREEQER